MNTDISFGKYVQNNDSFGGFSEAPNTASFEGDELATTSKNTNYRENTPSLSKSMDSPISVFETSNSIKFTDDDSSLYRDPSLHVDRTLLRNRYRIIRRIGRGAFGTVYLVQDIKTGIEYALKMIECADTNELNRAFQEVWPVKDIKHEGLVQYLDIFVHEDQDSITGTNTTRFCILMEYYSEGDLLQLIESKYKSQSQFTEREIIEYMRQLTEGVRYLHSRSLIHRDLKPQNCFVANQGKSLFIGDFGLVTKLESTFLSTVAGTLRFMAPEVLSNKKYEYAADIWSLGCIFYELVTLRLDRNMYMDVFSQNDFYRELLKEITEKHKYSQDLARLLVDMFQVQPTLRITTEEVLRRLSGYEKGEYSAHERSEVIVCEGCGLTALVECVGCKSFLCNTCFNDAHKFGVMKKHEKLEIKGANIVQVDKMMSQKVQRNAKQDRSRQVNEITETKLFDDKPKTKKKLSMTKKKASPSTDLFFTEKSITNEFNDEKDTPKFYGKTTAQKTSSFASKPTGKLFDLKKAK
jgi:serine/threonine protein kinase